MLQPQLTKHTPVSWLRQGLGQYAFCFILKSTVSYICSLSSGKRRTHFVQCAGFQKQFVGCLSFSLSHSLSHTQTHTHSTHMHTHTDTHRTHMFPITQLTQTDRDPDGRQTLAPAVCFGSGRPERGQRKHTVTHINKEGVQLHRAPGEKTLSLLWRKYLCNLFMWDYRALMGKMAFLCLRIHLSSISLDV